MSKLEQKRLEDYKKFADYQHTEVDPRLYKEKVGRKTIFTNPWKTLDERIRVEEKGHKLWKTWLATNQLCIVAGFPIVMDPSVFEWEKIQTVNGERFIKRSAEEMVIKDAESQSEATKLDI